MTCHHTAFLRIVCRQICSTEEPWALRSQVCLSLGWLHGALSEAQRGNLKYYLWVLAFVRQKEGAEAAWSKEEEEDPRGLCLVFASDALLTVRIPIPCLPGPSGDALLL